MIGTKKSGWTPGALSASSTSAAVTPSSTVRTSFTALRSLMAEGWRPTIRPGTDGASALPSDPLIAPRSGHSRVADRCSPSLSPARSRLNTAGDHFTSHSGSPSAAPVVVLEPHARPVRPLADAGELEVGGEVGDRQVVGPAHVAQLEPGALDRQALGQRRVVVREGRRRVLDALGHRGRVALAPGVEERLGVVGGLGRVVAEQLGHPVDAPGHDRGHHQGQDEGEHPAVVEHSPGR